MSRTDRALAVVTNVELREQLHQCRHSNRLLLTELRQLRGNRVTGDDIRSIYMDRDRQQATEIKYRSVKAHLQNHKILTTVIGRYIKHRRGHLTPEQMLKLPALLDPAYMAGVLPEGVDKAEVLILAALNLDARPPLELEAAPLKRLPG